MESYTMEYDYIARIYTSLAQRIVQVECTRMHTWDFECTEDGNQSYIGSRRQKCVLVRIRVHSTCNIICAIA